MFSYQPPLVDTEGNDWLGYWFDRTSSRRRAEREYEAKLSQVAWDTAWAAWWTFLLTGRYNAIMWETHGWCVTGIHQKHDTSGKLLTLRAVGAGKKDLVAFYQGNDWPSLFMTAREDIRSGTVAWKEGKPFGRA